MARFIPGGLQSGFPLATIRKENRMRVMGKFTTTLLLSAILIALPAAQAPRSNPEGVGISAERLKRVSELLKRHIDAGSFSGSVTLVSRNGRVAHLEAQGLMDIDTRKPMAPNALFRIMSMTKPVVGAAILMLIEDGRVRLNDPVSRFIPRFKELKVAVAQPEPAGRGGGAAPAPQGAAPAAPRFYTVPTEREITIKDLLTHTSGLVSGTISNSEARKPDVRLKGKESNADYIPRLGGVPLEFQPGSRWAYSAQAGFDALVLVVEVASGQKFDQFAQQRIFGPLGMKDTYFYTSDESFKPRIASRYDRTDKGLVKVMDEANFMNGVFLSGGGGLFTTAEDYLQFGLMLLNGGQLNGKRLLSPRMVELMRSMHIPDTLPGRPRGEGYGLSVRVVNDAVQRGTLLSNGTFGWSGAYGTHFFVDPEEKVVAVLMTQTSTPGVNADFENAVMQSIVEPVEVQ
jgi:CubicO group peptidase (beta-lactamase class C family)